MDLVDNDKGYDVTSDPSPSLNVASQHTHHCQVGFSGPLQAIRADISEETTRETY